MKVQIQQHSIWAFLLFSAAAMAPSRASPAAEQYFERKSTFFMCDHPNFDCTKNFYLQGSSSSMAYYTRNDGNTMLVHTDGTGKLGIVDITNPSNAIPGGLLGVDLGMKHYDGVAVIDGFEKDIGGPFALIADNDTGGLKVLDLTDESLYSFIPPGSVPYRSRAEGHIVVSNGDSFPKYVILNDGGSSLQIVTIADASTPVSAWTSKKVDIEDYRFVEFAFNADNTQVVVALQLKNRNVIVDIETASIVDNFDAGTVQLTSFDYMADGRINQTATAEVGRNPKHVTWIGDTTLFATATGYGYGESHQSFTIFDSVDGSVVYDSENTMDIEAVRIGHYDDGTEFEPSAIRYVEANGQKYLFVLLRRNSIVFVYELSDPSEPTLLQTLPVDRVPLDMVFVEETNVLAVLSEGSDVYNEGVTRAGVLRSQSSITLFQLTQADHAEYPMIVSAPRKGNGPEGPFIPFSGLSGLSAAAPYGMNSFSNAAGPNILYAVTDDADRTNRILTIDTSAFPALVTDETRILDANYVFRNSLNLVIEPQYVANAASWLVNTGDDTVQYLNPKGIAVSAKGGFWIVSAETRQRFDNILMKLDDSGVISECIYLDYDMFPEEQLTNGLGLGFVGVAEDGDNVVVAFWHAMDKEENPRIAVYNTVSETWKYAFYPLEDPSLKLRSRVELSDIAYVGPGRFYVLERDDQVHNHAAVKQISVIDLGNYTFEDGTTLEKELYLDMVPDLLSTNGQVDEKIDGLAVTSDGKVWISNDNKKYSDNYQQVFMTIARLPTESPSEMPSEMPTEMPTKSSKSGKSDKSDKSSKTAKRRLKSHKASSVVSPVASPTTFQ